jgi:dTDP-4-amino-4,6-dideoxygalactose transaminase
VALSGEPTPSRKQFLVFGAPAIEQEEIREVVASLESGWLGTGPKVARFEDEFKEYKGAAHALAVNSCTAALHLSLIAAGVGPGDEVITSALTFCATANAVIHAGAMPVIVDVDPITMNLDPRLVADRITSRTKALVPVHFAGRCCDMDRLMALAEAHSLLVVEDCAHAIETEYKGRKAGTFGDFGCFSFYVTKNVVAGEGGMVLARRETDAARIKVLALHGMTKDAWHRFSDEGYKHYQVVEAGFKYNMMDLQAAIGIHQLQRVEQNWRRREAIWRRYNEALNDLPLTLPSDPEPNTRHAYHLYTVLVDEALTGITRDDFLQAMTELNIGVGVHYLSLAEQPFYQERFGWRPEDYPEATRIGRQTVSLPLSPKLNDRDVEDVLAAIREVISGHHAT